MPGLSPGTNWGSFIPPAYSGAGAFSDALSYYGGEMFGRAHTGAGDLAQAGGYDAGAAGYYGTPTAPVSTGGAGQAKAQGRFGALLGSEAQARAAADMARQQSLIQGATGISNTAGRIGSDITSNLTSNINLTNAKNQQLFSNLGLLLNGVSSIASPTGSVSNVYNAIPGVGNPGSPGVPGVSNPTGPSSMLSSIISALIGGAGSAGSADLLGSGMVDAAGAFIA